VTVSARVEDKDSFNEKVLGYTLNTLMGLRSVSMNLTRDGSTTLPGFRPDNDLFSSGTTPGWDFALGQQSRNVLTGKLNDQGEFYFVEDYLDKEWLVTETTFSEPFLISSGEQVTLRATIEPLAGLSIKLNSNYTHQERVSAYYVGADGKYTRSDLDYKPTNITRSGNYMHTYMALGSMFNDQLDDLYTSEAFNNFVAFRKTIATRQTSQIFSGIDEQKDYEDVSADPNSSEVLIPAFLAAYSGKEREDLDNVSLSTSPTWRSMLPNWSVTYAGLAKTKLLKDYVKTLTLSHRYTSTYNVGNFISQTDYDPTAPSTVFDTKGNEFYQSENDISAVTISEGLNPLIGVDVTLNNNISFDFALNKLRSLALNISSNQLIESRNDEIVIGAGYRFEDFKLFVKTSNSKKKRTINNDLRINADFSIRDVVSIIRRIDEVNVQPSSGNKVTALKFTANYNVNNNLEVTLFYDKQITSPVVSTSFRTSNSNFGVTFRFSLTQ
jgi:cell surface protein SprA